MKKVNINSINEYGDKVSVRAILETSSTKEISIFMKAGQSMKEHQSKFPILIHLLEGAIDFGVNDDRHTLLSGDIISLEGAVPHDLIATDDSNVRLTLMKADSIDRVNMLA